MNQAARVPLAVLFGTFLRLGLTSFGGPVAHLGFYHAEFVVRRQWLTEEEYADLVALAQFLPGPASSQVGFATGFLLGGWLGALLAWAGFTLPSVALMVGFGWWLERGGPVGAAEAAGWILGLKVAAVAIVAQAVAGMWASLVHAAGDPKTTQLRATLALGTAALLLLWPVGGALGQLLALAVSAAVGWRWLPVLQNPDKDITNSTSRLAVPLTRRGGVLVLLLALLPLLLLPLLRPLGPAFALTDTVYRAGALVFGGGHVVLPLLQAGLVPHFLSQDTFTAGYGVANAVPGPLFTFASYLGAAQGQVGRGWGALLATVAIFWPGLLLMLGALPFWATLIRAGGMRRAVSGLNAGVVGLLLAALYHPVFTSAVLPTGEGAASPEHSAQALGVMLLAYAALVVWRLPPWAVVAGCAVLGQGLWG